MRVKVLIALAIASVLLILSTGTAMASSDSTSVPVTAVDGTAVAEALQQQAFAAASADAFGFPVLDGINAEALATDADLQATGLISGIDACPLNTLSTCDGDCGVCPECTCEERLTTFEGPIVNLGCPVVNTVPERVDLVSPVIKPEFPTINLAPQATIALPQVNAKLNCFDINCGDCGCPVVEKVRDDKVR
ncbi:hypothetical protein [Methanocella sp. MCL-LM]|uniref:hypothetical protein n=1 Tax=Methanocella sp. MCL-LM TaxID=3412035 RepID=UPI003C755E9E